MLAKCWQLLSAGEVVNGGFDARLEHRSAAMKPQANSKPAECLREARKLV